MGCEMIQHTKYNVFIISWLVYNDRHEKDNIAVSSADTHWVSELASLRPATLLVANVVRTLLNSYMIHIQKVFILNSRFEAKIE